jgi:hypothetical protein
MHVYEELRTFAWAQAEIDALKKVLHGQQADTFDKLSGEPHLCTEQRSQNHHTL